MKIDLRLPLTTPRVIRSDVLDGYTAILINGDQFADGLRRVVISADVTDETKSMITQLLRSHDQFDAEAAWLAELLGKADGGA